MDNRLKEISNSLKVLVEDEEKKDKAAEKIRRDKFEESTEENELKKRSWVTFVILVLIIVGATIATCIRILNDSHLLATSIIVGILGSATTALLSALDRKSNGWESKEGDKYPEHGKVDRFSERMYTFFLFRPLLGIVAGLIVYFAFQQEYVSPYNKTEEDSKVLFYSLIAGLFIKTLLDKIKDIIDKILSSVVK